MGEKQTKTKVELVGMRKNQLEILEVKKNWYKNIE